MSAPFAENPVHLSAAEQAALQKWAAVSEVEEQSIDRLATAIARFLPLPTWPMGAPK